MTGSVEHGDTESSHGPNDLLSGVVRIFLESNLSIMLIIFSLIAGIAALIVTPREEDPQIVVPLADIFVQFPGHSAAEVEQLVSTPLERILYQIDGVEYVYSMSREHQAVITVRFLVGEDRERSLVKLFKKLDENQDLIPAGVTGWVVKPVEIDDVPIVTLTLTGASDDTHALRRIGEEAIQRLAVIPDVSRTGIIGGEPRRVHLVIHPEKMQGYHLSLLDLQRSLAGANAAMPAGQLVSGDSLIDVETASILSSAEQLEQLVVGVVEDRPVFLRDIVSVVDGPDEVSSYVRHGLGPGYSFRHPELVEQSEGDAPEIGTTHPAVTLTLSKQKGANAVAVAEAILKGAEELRRDVIPADVHMTVTRNYGRSANEKVNELVEGLGVAIVIVVALLTLSLGWREAFIVAVAVPVVFGLTLVVNLLFGYTINRVTLFALILALGLLVDDPIVDVENIARHFEQKKRATRKIVLEAVAEIRPPLISATLAVIVSFLPMFFITGMMGPYMSPMALNVPVSMLMSMVVAFTITPWLCFHMLKVKASHGVSAVTPEANSSGEHELYDPEVIKRSMLYRFFRPIMVPILQTRGRALLFLLATALITIAATSMAATRSVPLKMLPFDNRNEFLIVLDMPENASLEQTDSVVSKLERLIAAVPEVTDFTSYTGVPGPVDFNGLVRHYALRQTPNLAEIRVNLTGKKNRRDQSHAITLRIRDQLTKLAEEHGGIVRLVEIPPGPPVISSIVAEVYGQPEHRYQDLLDAGDRVARRMQLEPGLIEVDSIRESRTTRMEFITDQEKAGLAGISVAEIAATIRIAVEGLNSELLRVEDERQPLVISLRLPQELRSHVQEIGQIQMRNSAGKMIPLAEIGQWREVQRDQTIYHKNLQRVVYVFAECAGRTPAECIMDVTADQLPDGSVLPDSAVATDGVQSVETRSVETRTFFHNGGGVAWSVPKGIRVGFSGEGEWKITLDVFRDLGLAFAAAMVMIYIILVAQTGSFALPLVVMLAIPLTIIGVMPGFWMLNVISGDVVGGYTDPVYFTATGMIGMIALAGIVTRDSIILVDFIELSVKHGRPLFDAILESRVVRLRPILLTAGAALLSSIPITFDPIFSGLGWALIFGLISSTAFTLFVIPISYWLLRK
ncbi:MAG: efflux RND transporter permease subunit [Planctomyces sp.]|nr:efflux RND transporter permease subunit [Planctomyces sp.]